jgi:tellurite resistance protein TerC
MEIWVWLGFLTLIFIFLALDLGVFNKNAHTISTKEALSWTVVWIVVSLLFSIVIYYFYEYNVLGIGSQDIGEDLSGREATLKYITGYILEKSLSIDNIFVIAMIFTFFKVEQQYQHKILFWGILGALLMRGVLILVGTTLLHQFDWLMYIFGGFLLFTAFKMLLIKEDDEIDPQKNILIRIAQKIYPVGTNDGGNFFTRVDGKKAITPLFLVLLVVESTDLMFAFDSIPAIMGVTTDSFLIYTSNIFAILGLRSLYFALASILDKFRFLKISLVFVLAFVGVKMCLIHIYKVPTILSLSVIVLALSIGVLASVYTKPSKTTIKEPTDSKKDKELV